DPVNRWTWWCPPGTPTVGWGASASTVRANLLDELADLVIDLTAFLHEGLDLVDGVDDRCVIPSPEFACDRRIGQIGEFTKHVHGDLSRRDQRAASTTALQVFDGEPEHLRGRIKDQLWGDRTWPSISEDVMKVFLGLLECQGFVHEIRQRRHPVERTFEFSDVVGDVGRDEHE